MSRMSDFMDEHDRILFVTDWSVQSQFNTLHELYDTPVKVVRRDGAFDFSTEFHIKDVTYIFDAREVSDGVYSIGFHRKGDVDMFTSKGEKLFVGDVIAGVFRSIKKLLDVKDVKQIVFNTGDKDLISFYDKMSKYVDKRFGFVLHKRTSRVGLVEWVYRRNK